MGSTSCSHPGGKAGALDGCDGTTGTDGENPLLAAFDTVLVLAAPVLERSTVVFSFAVELMLLLVTVWDDELFASSTTGCPLSTTILAKGNGGGFEEVAVTFLSPAWNSLSIRIFSLWFWPFR